MPRARITTTFRTTAVRSAAVLAAALLLPGLNPAAAAAATPSPPVPRLVWQSCAPDADCAHTQAACAPGFECATAAVPLDHRDPRGRTVDLALIRRPATDPAHRIGTLFYNPGGPGIPGTMALPAVYPALPDQVRARFDVVSFDPRGIGRSTTLPCFPDPAVEQGLLDRLPKGFPEGGEQQSAWASAYSAFAAQCAANDRDGLRAHLSTADVARDLDLLRQAVGDRALSYLGTSYGSYLGATYANLFPRRVRAMVLDSGIDPVAWSTGRTPGDRDLAPFLRTGSDRAAARTLDAFLDRCGEAGPAACAFAADGARESRGPATRAKFTRLLDRLRHGPVTLDGATVDRAAALTAAQLLLYAVAPVPGLPDTGWPGLGGYLQRLWTAPDAPAPAPTGGDPRQAQTLGVLCADTDNPPAGADWSALADLAEARSGATGPYWVWQNQRCATWPASPDRYTGPWDRPTSAPILVVALTGDPAWPYEGSRALADTLARGRLLTVEGYGHTVLGNPNACAAGYEERYLLSGRLPERGAVCAAQGQPFAS
ncbi:alpha/beta hydrolase [Kitasatospora sp. NPDC094028]